MGETSNTPSLFNKIKEDMVLNVVEEFLPKIEPFIEPALAKIEEYFGDDEKIFVMKKTKAGVKVIILDNTVGEYTIKSGNNKEFNVDKDAIVTVVDVKDFVKKLLNGSLIQSFNKLG